MLEPAIDLPPSSPQPIPFQAAWTGTATSYAGAQPITLDFEAPGQINVQLGDQARVPLVKPMFENGALIGRFDGRSIMPDAAKAQHGLSLKLVLLDGDLVGQMVAQGMNANTAFMLPSLVRLRAPPAKRWRGLRGRRRGR